MLPDELNTIPSNSNNSIARDEHVLPSNTLHTHHPVEHNEAVGEVRQVPSPGEPGHGQIGEATSISIGQGPAQLPHERELTQPPLPQQQPAPNAGEGDKRTLTALNIVKKSASFCMPIILSFLFSN